MTATQSVCRTRQRINYSATATERACGLMRSSRRRRQRSVPPGAIAVIALLFLSGFLQAQGAEGPAGAPGAPAPAGGKASPQPGQGGSEGSTVPEAEQAPV